MFLGGMLQTPHTHRISPWKKLLWETLAGTPLVQRASFLPLHSSLFGTAAQLIGPKSFFFATAQFSLWHSSTVNYGYIVTSNINTLLIGSRCIPSGAHTNHCWANLAHASKRIKHSKGFLKYMYCIKYS